MAFVNGSFKFQTNGLMKSAIFWDITPCSQLTVNRHFGGTYHLHLQGRRINRARNQRESRWQAEPVPPKRRLTFNGLHGVISQKIVLFITTAVRTSDPANGLIIMKLNTHVM
jgi:hypothetical protein